MKYQSVCRRHKDSLRAGERGGPVAAGPWLKCGLCPHAGNFGAAETAFAVGDVHARDTKPAMTHALVRPVSRVYGSGMMDWTQCPAVERVPGKVSGAWLFKNTRVPVRALFENLEGGATVEQFLEWFPGVNREQVMTVLKFTESSLAEVVA